MPFALSPDCRSLAAPGKDKSWKHVCAVEQTETLTYAPLANLAPNTLRY